MLEAEQDRAAVARALSSQRSDALAELRRAEDFRRRVGESSPHTPHTFLASGPRGTLGPSDRVELRAGGARTLAQMAADADRDVQAARAAVARLDARLAEINAGASPLAARLVEAMRALPPGVRIALYDGAAPKAKGDPASIVEAARSKRAELLADRHEVQSRPYPPSVAKATIERQIDTLAAAGEPHLLTTLELNRPAQFRNTTVRVPAVGAIFNMVDTAGLVAWLFRDQLIAKMHEAIDDISDGDPGLDDAQRAEAEAEIAGAILEQERLEEAAIEIAAATGAALARRADADYRAVLGLSDDLPGPAR